MHDRVVEQVHEQSTRQRLVADRCVLEGRRRSVDALGRGQHGWIHDAAEIHRSAKREGSDRTHACRDQLVQIHRARLERPLTSIHTGEQEQLADDVRQAAALGPHDFERVAVLSGGPLTLREGDVGFPAHDRHWRSQLVGGIGHEAPLLHEGGIEAGQEVVEHRRELPHLVARVPDGEPCVQARRADVCCTGGHRRHRCQTAASKPVAAEPGQQQSTRDRDQESGARVLE